MNRSVATMASRRVSLTSSASPRESLQRGDIVSTEHASMDVAIVPSLARHLAFSPVAFAVTDGPAHALRYANAAFRLLQSAGDITIGEPASRATYPVV